MAVCYAPCYVRSTLDALIILQGVTTGVLGAVIRRLTPEELQEHIRSGALFVYEEHTSGIQRWTDRLKWSNSRSIGNFFGYLQLCGPEERTSTNPQPHPTVPKSPFEHDLIGALDSIFAHEQYKEDGLVKRTFSVPELGLHLVNYVRPSDVRKGLLPRPSSMPCYNRFRRASQFNPALMREGLYRSPLMIATDENGMYINAEDEASVSIKVETNDANEYRGGNTEVMSASSGSASPPSTYGDRYDDDHTDSLTGIDSPASSFVNASSPRSYPPSPSPSCDDDYDSPLDLDYPVDAPYYPQYRPDIPALSSYYHHHEIPSFEPVAEPANVGIRMVFDADNYSGPPARL